MPLTETVFILILAAIAWVWIDSLRAREACLAAVRSACEDDGLQFLDETVSVSRLRLARDDGGQLRIERHYAFEYSDTGNNRRRGGATLLGQEITMLNLGLRLAS
jgi:hypothetical protein